MRRSAVLVCLGLFITAAAGDQPLTLERIFSDPPLEGTLPQELTWLPDGARFSYLETTGEGKDAVTKLSVLDAATGAAVFTVDETKFPPFSAQDIQVKAHLAGYQWSPDGKALLLQGDGELFFLPVPDGELRRLTTTTGAEEQPQFSPDGRWVAFVRDNDLFALNLASSKEKRLSEDGGPDRINGKFDWVYQEELAGPATRGFVWSPDSKLILYISLDEKQVPRFPLSNLLLVHPETNMTIYPAPGDPNPVPSLRLVQVVPDETGESLSWDSQWTNSEKYLVRFGWTGKGSGYWYQLLDRSQTHLSLSRSVDKSAPSESLLVETDPAWINLHDDLRFLQDGTFIWSTEKNGFRQLMLHDAKGQLIRPLTSGEWEVIALSGVNETTGWVYFSGTGPDPREQHLFRVKLDGTGLKKLTGEKGTHAPVLGKGEQYALDTFSTADHPRSIWLLDPEGRRLRAVAPNERPPLFDHRLGAIRQVTVNQEGGKSLFGQLVLPPDFDPGKKYPAIVYTYGGPHAQLARDGWGGRYTLFHQYLASQGFVVFWLDNRGSARRGRDFERALYRRLGKTELEDQLAGVAYLKNQPFIDSSRLGIWGWSYGGYMTCYALVNAPGVFRAGAAVAPVTDWRYYDSIYTERYLKGPADNPEGYRDSSPVNQADRLEGALLLIHGTGDDNVHWQNTLAMIEALYKAGKPYDLQLYPNKTHGIGGKEARIHLHRRIAGHFIRNLKP